MCLPDLPNVNVIDTYLLDITAMCHVNILRAQAISNEQNVLALMLPAFLLDGNLNTPHLSRKKLSTIAVSTALAPQQIFLWKQLRNSTPEDN